MASTDLYSDLEYRGLIKQVTSPEIAKKLASEKVTLYCGFDPTADSLHVGSMLQLVTLNRFRKAGHQIIAVVGGATGMIGDPSGKSQERSQLDEGTLRKNQAGIQEVIERLLAGDEGPKPLIVNNYDWFKEMTFIELLRDVGKHFTVNHMMAKESVRARLEDREHGISYTEFSYMILQSYDYWVLHQKHGCNLQIGGSDQWGNIVAGIDFIRRMKAHASPNPSVEEPDTVYGITSPLVNKADGTKFGKTESGTVWLSSARTSPYQLYQFFIGTADADVVNFLKFFTFLSRAEIDALENEVKSAPEKRAAQNRLAEEVVRMVHGEAALKRAQQATKALFGTEIKELDAETLGEIFAGAPATVKPQSALEPGASVLDLLVESQLCASKGAARKDITGGGIYLNNERVSDPNAVVTRKDLIGGIAVVFRKGKKSYHLVRFE